MPTYVRFVELPVIDQQRAVRFYTEKLGFGVAQDLDYKADWRWITLEIPGAQTRILLARGDGQRRDVPSLVLTVDDVQASYRDLVKKGVEFVDEPQESPWGGELFAVLRDSEGNLVMLGSEARPA